MYIWLQRRRKKTLVTVLNATLHKHVLINGGMYGNGVEDLFCWKLK